MKNTYPVRKKTTISTNPMMKIAIVMVVISNADGDSKCLAGKRKLKLQAPFPSFFSLSFKEFKECEYLLDKKTIRK